LGLVNHVTPAETLLAETRKILLIIMSKAPLAIAEVIALGNYASQGNSDGLQREIAAFGKLFETADLKEGATAFLEKRKPNFTGK
jgi:enoyl-CoA hydratase